MNLSMLRRSGQFRTLFVMVLIVLSATMQAAADDAAPQEVLDRVAQPDQRPVHPYRGVIQSADDIRLMRQLARSDARFADSVKQWLDTADQWLAMSEHELIDLMPPEGASYAYGFAGDPKTNGSWARYGRNGLCDMSRPGTVLSPYTGDLYGNQLPGEQYYDPGDGWVRPSDGQRYFFKGIWNAYAFDQILGALHPLANAYILTGDERYAERTLLILDLMADRVGDPDKRTKVLDWVGPPEPMEFFFNFTGNWANTRVFLTAAAFDLVAGDGRSEQLSRFRPQSRLVDLMRDRLLLVCEPWKITDNDNLQNHALCAYSASLMRSLLFADETLIRRDIEATYAFLDNTVNRDGDYYEASSVYANTGRAYGGRLILMLHHLMQGSDGNPPSLGQWSDLLPQRPPITQDPRWCTLALPSIYQQSMYGRMLTFADQETDHEVGFGFSTADWRSLREMTVWLYNQVQDAQWKLLAQRVYWAIPDRIRSAPTFAMTGSAEVLWLTPPPLPQGVEPMQLIPDESFLRPAKRLVLLRDGTGQQQRGLFVRGGANVSHCHDDQMAAVLYAKGLLATGEFGYNVWGVPAHKGFGVQPVAHCGVVVDEGLPSDDRLYREDVPDAVVQSYLPIQPVQLIELSNPHRWRGSGITQYQRSLAMVHVDDQRFYSIDVFRVTGGKMHDYLWYGTHQAKDGPASDFQLTGPTPETIDNVWSLAALDHPERQAEVYNQPGYAWGERIMAGNSQIQPRLEGERADYQYLQWNPPPGNGYGFLFDVKAADTNQPWQAQWQLHDNKSLMRLSMISPQQQTLVTARAGTLEIDDYFRAVVSRRRAANDQPLQSCYVSVVEVAEPQQFAVKQAQWVPPQVARGNASDIASLLIDLADGRQDRILATDAADSEVSAASMQLIGRYGFVRRDASGRVTDATLVSGTQLSDADFSLRLAASEWTSHVQRVDAQLNANNVLVDSAIPAQVAALDSLVRFSSPPDAATPYVADEVMALKSVSVPHQGNATMLEFAEQQLNDTRLEVKQIHDDGSIELIWPNELYCSSRANRFDGSQIVVEADPTRTTTLLSFDGPRRIHVADPNQLKPGDGLLVRVTQPRDRITIPTFAVLHQTSNNTWTLTANHDVQLTIPAPDGQVLQVMSDDGQTQPLATATSGRIEANLPLSLSSDGKLRLQLVEP
ncbi:MAG: hypothetical protein IT445_12690 [Phycisphaeraceae bacterium]|nr:hypothetical protein [Phycisphaeraceae bacterium]